MGTLTWKRLAAKYYMIDGIHRSSHSWFTNLEGQGRQVHKEGKAYRERKARKRVDDTADVKRYLIVGSKSWNELYLEYEWKDHEFGEKLKQSLPKFMNTVEKRREIRRNKFFAMFDHKAQKDACWMWFNPHLDIYPLIIILWMETCTRNEWMNEWETNQEGLPHPEERW